MLMVFIWKKVNFDKIARFSIDIQNWIEPTTLNKYGGAAVNIKSI